MSSMLPREIHENLHGFELDNNNIGNLRLVYDFGIEITCLVHRFQNMLRFPNRREQIKSNHMDKIHCKNLHENHYLYEEKNHLVLLHP